MINENHNLFALRMKWLAWVSLPIKYCWNFIVDSFYYSCSIVRLSWSSMKMSINIRYLLIANIGSSIAALIFLVYWFMIINRFDYGLNDDLIISSLIMSILISFAVCWTYAEIANLIRYKEIHGREIDVKRIISSLGNGFNALKIYYLYIAVIIIMLVIQAIFDVLSFIPTVGPTFLGILIIPLIVCSAIIILSFVIIYFGMPFLGTHLLTLPKVKGKMVGNFIKISLSLFKVIKSKFLDMITASMPVFFLGILVTILPMLLILSSVALSTGIAFKVANGDMNAIYNIISSYTEQVFIANIGGFFMIISLSIIAGFTYSFMYSLAACTFYSLYNFNSNYSILNKIFGIIFILAIIFMLLGGFMSIFSLGFY